MRVELIAQHRQLRRGRLRLEHHQLVGLFLDTKEIVDREIERRPGAEQRRVEEEGTDRQGRKIGVGGAQALKHPAVDEAVKRARGDEDGKRQRPGDDRPLMDQAAIEYRHDQRQRKAGDRRDDRRDEIRRRLAIGERGRHAQRERADPAGDLEKPESAHLIGEKSVDMRSSAAHLSITR